MRVLVKQAIPQNLSSELTRMSHCPNEINRLDYIRHSTSPYQIDGNSKGEGSTTATRDEDYFIKVHEVRNLSIPSIYRAPHNTAGSLVRKLVEITSISVILSDQELDGVCRDHGEGMGL